MCDLGLEISPEYDKMEVLFIDFFLNVEQESCTLGKQ